MKKFRSLAAVVVVMAMLLTSFAGCGSDDFENSGNDNIMKSGIYLGKGVQTVTFLDSLESMPDSGATDISEAQDGSVMMWSFLDIQYVAGDGGVTANQNCSGLFGANANLMEINFDGNFYTGNVTDMSYMFCQCTALTSLDLSSLDTSNVTNMSSMFSNCSSLIELDLSNFNTSNVTNMKYMFYKCRSLRSLDIGDSFVISSGTDTYEIVQDASSYVTKIINGLM